MPQVVYPRQATFCAFPNLLHSHCITNIWRRKQIISAFMRECEFCILYTTESWLTRLHRTHHLISFNRHHRTLATLRKLTNSVAQEPEGSSPHSQQPATGPCPEPVESNPHSPKPVSLRSILIPSSHLCLGLPSGLFPSGFPTKTLYTWRKHETYLLRHYPDWNHLALESCLASEDWSMILSH
jgi:hypothetical protein